MRSLSLVTINAIKNSLRDCLENKATFPEHVKAITGAGVTRYQVDLLSSEVSYYFADGAIHIEKIPPTKSHFDPRLFSKAMLRSAIDDIRARAIDYRTFLDCIVSAGTKSYEVKIDEARVIYYGESENYVEEFPKSS